MSIRRAITPAPSASTARSHGRSLLVRVILCPLATVLILAIPTLAAAMEQPSVVTSGEPRVELIGHEHIVVLPKPMKKALDRFSPKFTVWRDRDYCSWYVKQFTTRQAPFAVIGDFNGDGVLDVALPGHTEHEALIIAVLSKAGKFAAV